MTDTRDKLRGLAAQFRQEPTHDAQETPETPHSGHQRRQDAPAPSESPHGARQRPQEPQQTPEPAPAGRTTAGPTLTELADGDPEPASPAEPRQRPQPAALPGGKTKTSLNLPETLAGRLRAWRDDTGRTNGDAIVSALIEHLDDLRHACVADAQRIELGLAPVAAPVQEARQLVTFWATAEAIDALDTAAASLAMNRSALIAALLDIYLPPRRLA